MLFCLLLLLVVALPSQASAAPMVTMSVVDADVRDVLTGLATIGKVNVVIDDSVSGKISVNFRNIPFESAIDTIVRSKGLSMHRTGNVLVFASLEKMEKGRVRMKTECFNQKGTLVLTGEAVTRLAREIPPELM